MKCLILLFVNLFMTGPESDSLVPSPDLTAFTHPLFFYSNNCDCSRYSGKDIWCYVYHSPALEASGASWVINPPNFEVGHAVTITGKEGDFFRVKFEKVLPGSYELPGGDMPDMQYEYCVKKGDLGTWISNYDSICENHPVPLYENPSRDANVIAWAEPDNNVAIILDIRGEWMYVETTGHMRQNKLRGWLDPKMQCGNPYGIDDDCHCKEKWW